MTEVQLSSIFLDTNKSQPEITHAISSFGMRLTHSRVLVACIRHERTLSSAAASSAPHLRRTPPSQSNQGRIDVPGVSHIIAISSGKGGVGKSTVTVNIAACLSLKHHLKVGILDADIFGPSIPTLMRLVGKQPAVDEELKQLIPLENYGIKCMSMGFLAPKDDAVVWRGPMVMSMLQQMLRDVRWAPLDILLIDLPPGTGDAQLTIAQRASLSGAVVVCTPQDLALSVAMRGIAMFKKVEVPVLGIVENMSYYSCSECGHKDHVFGHGGAKAAAHRLGLPFLGEVPLTSIICSRSDDGRPIVTAAATLKEGAVDPATAAISLAFESITDSIVAKLKEIDQKVASDGIGPKIVLTE